MLIFWSLIFISSMIFISSPGLHRLNNPISYKTDMGSLMNQHKVICLWILHFLVFWSSSSSVCPPNQSSALLHFKNKFSINRTASFMDCDEDAGVKSYPKTESWKKGTDCCSWDGVICDGLTGNVIGLDLSCSWLYGNFPTNSSLFFLLPHLQRLNVAHNDFNGSQIPSGFGQLVSLTHLNLSYSAFSGLVPSEISRLYNLVVLDLSFNSNLRIDVNSFILVSRNLTGVSHVFLDEVNMSSVVPNAFLNLSSSLVSLSLFNCQLQGEFPLNLFHFPYLKHLRMASNYGLVGVLPKSNWTGPLEFLDLSVTSFSGELQFSIGNLKSLKLLYLENCRFTGSIPSSLWNLTGITHLDISNNGFTGQIPSSLSNLEQLTLLDLSLNIFEGKIPDVFRNLSRVFSLSLVNNNFSGLLPLSVFNLSKLSKLDLSGNQLEGSLPDNVNDLSELVSLSLSGNRISGAMPSWLFSLSSLEVLRLSGNRFKGEVPEVLSRSLKYIYLDENVLQGEIPKSIFELANLTDLFLSSNNLTGILDMDMFSGLRNLRRLDLSHTNLTVITANNVNQTWPMIYLLMLSSCNISEFPDFLRTQEEIQYLDLSNNNIHGNLPRWMSDVGKETLSLLDLSNNLLTGIDQLPWKNLKVLDLHSNMISGPLPVPPLSMTFFSISNNTLSGELPSSICNASLLQILDLSRNNLRGGIPLCVGNLSKTLSVLDLGMNNFHGTIPNMYAKECNLRNLNLQGNQLEGSLPPSLINCRMLEVLDLGNNMLNDTFPHWLGSLPELQVIALRDNKLYGSIPDMITNDSFSKLLVLDLSNNNLVGRLPTRHIQSFKAMINVDDGKSMRKYLGDVNHSFDYTMMVTVKGFEIQMQKIFHVFTSIDLSSNNFQGEIPEVLGILHSLRGLNLSHNSLSGYIPSSLGKLSNLEWLDLHENNLTGEIPGELSELTSLAILNLSRNQLVGHIPQGKQFGTFTASSYEGNLGLCGFPLSRTCGDEELPESPLPSGSEQEANPSMFDSGFGWRAILIGYGFGTVVGVTIGYVMFQTEKPEWLLMMIAKMQPGKIKEWSRSLHCINGRRN